MISIKEIPDKMKVLNLHGIANLQLEEIDTPKIKENEVLVEIKYCGICSSDNDRIFKNGTYHFPTIPGHEFSGEIVGVYDKKDNNLLEKKVSVFPLLPCFNCEACQMEEYAQCSNYNYFGSRCDGGYAQYLAVPKWNLIFFDDIPYDVAALCEPAAVALHALRRIELSKNDKVLIMGNGTVGLLLALFAKEYGYKPYIGIRKEKNKKLIESLGLNVINTNDLGEEVTKNTDGLGFKYIFEAVGSNESISNCIMASGNFAKIVLIGNPYDDLKLEKNVYWRILRKQISLAGTWNSNYSNNINDWQDALAFMKNNYQTFKKLITHIYSLEEYEEAFRILRDKSEGKIKVMFEVNKE